MIRKNAESGPESGAVLRRELMRSYLAELYGADLPADEYLSMTPGKSQAEWQGTLSGEWDAFFDGTRRDVWSDNELTELGRLLMRGYSWDKWKYQVQFFNHLMPYLKNFLNGFLYHNEPLHCGVMIFPTKHL